MPARVPLDVDLEDRLVYGLTPTRFAYVVLALLTGFALWTSGWAPLPVRAGAAFIVIGAGAAVAWGRWMGRPADAWVIDVALFVTRTHTLEWRVRRMPTRSRAESEESPAALAEELAAAA